MISERRLIRRQLHTSSTPLNLDNNSDTLFHNLSELPNITHDLSHSLRPLKSLLPKGLKFLPTPTHNLQTFNNLKTTLKDIIRSIKLKEYFGSLTDNDNLTPPNNPYTQDNSLLPFIYNSKLHTKSTWTPQIRNNNIIQLETNILSDFTQHRTQIQTYATNIDRDNLDTYERKFLKSLKENKQFSNIYITPADKNLGCCILHTSEYLVWIADYFVKNEHAYILISSNNIEESTTNIRKNIYDLVFNWYEKYNFDMGNCFIEPDKNTKQLKKILIGAQHGKLNKFYAMPKLHKNHSYLKWGVRPICSYSGSQLELLSVWLDLMLRPYLKHRIILESSDQLLELLESISLLPGDLLFTSDVTALYTNINNSLAYETIEKHIETHPLKIPILEGLKIVMENNYFEIGNCIFKQSGGTAMGTPVAVAYANLFLLFFENSLLPSSKEIIFYVRYIDDILGLYRPDNTLEPTRNLEIYFEKLTNLTKLEFTTQISNKSVIFLDLEIFIHNNQLLTRTYQKELNLYQYIREDSAHPKACLKGLIIGLIQIYFKQNSLESDFIKIVRLLKQRLVKRGYSYPLINNLVHSAILKTKNNPPLTYSARKRLKSLKNSLDSNEIFFPIRFNPTYKNLGETRNIFRLNFIESQMKENTEHVKNGKMITCYFNPPNLRKLLIKSTINKKFSPYFSSVYDLRKIRNSMDIKEFLEEIAINIFDFTENNE